MAEAYNFEVNWKFALKCLRVFFGYRYLLPAILAGGYLYLLVFRRKSREVLLFSGSLLLAAVIFNPLLQPLLIRLGDKSTFYRFFWTIPFMLLAAYFLAAWIRRIPVKWGRVLAGVLAAGILLGTQPVYSQFKDNFRKPDNYYKVPNALIYACEEIHKDYEGKFGPIDPDYPRTSPRVFFPEGLDVYARQYDASLRMTISRNRLLRFFGSKVVGENATKRKGSRRIILNVMYGRERESTEDFKKALRATRTRYLVVPDGYTCHDQIIEAGGEVIARGNGVVIYYLDHPLPRIIRRRVRKGLVPGYVKTESDETAGEQQETMDVGGAVWNVNHYELSLPGVERPYRFVILNDLHLIAGSEDVLPEKQEDANLRRTTLFIDGQGNRSADIWPALAAQVDAMGADGVIIAGDLLDFYSQANVKLAGDALAAMQTPVMYLRADHDVGAWNTGEAKETIRGAHEGLASYEPVEAMRFPAFTIAGINDSTSQLSKEAAQVLDPLLTGDAPVILFTHVPFAPAEDTGLAAASRAAWQDRSLLWGEADYYRPNETTQQTLDLLMDEDSAVAAVFAGHLHLRYDGPLYGAVTQHVLDAGYKGNIAVLTVTGA